MSVNTASLLVLANSGRAIAESAQRAGYQVTVLDLFCDQDTRTVADCWPVTQGFASLDVDILADEIASLVPNFPCGVIYGAGLEESASLLKRLSSCCHLFGNDPSVLEMLRRPRRFFSLLDRLGIPHPEVSFSAPCSETGRSWLFKRAGSCGGQGVAYFSSQYAAADSTCYYQKYTPGQVMSVLFIADGERHRTIGYNILGKSGANASAPFLYNGAIGQASLRDGMRSQIEQVVEKLVSRLGLRGINSIDFIHNDAGGFVIDLNPRPTATLELYEHLMPEGWIKLHIEACRGELPVMPIVASAEMHGHQIVYAPRTIEIPVETAWPRWIKDRPGNGARVHQGEPVCSLYAKGASASEVEGTLRQRRDEVLRMLFLPIYQPLSQKVAV